MSKEEHTTWWWIAIICLAIGMAQLLQGALMYFGVFQ